MLAQAAQTAAESSSILDHQLAPVVVGVVLSAIGWGLVRIANRLGATERATDDLRVDLRTHMAVEEVEAKARTESLRAVEREVGEVKGSIGALHTRLDAVLGAHRVGGDGG